MKDRTPPRTLAELQNNINSQANPQNPIHKIAIDFIKELCEKIKNLNQPSNSPHGNRTRLSALKGQCPNTDRRAGH